MLVLSFLRRGIQRAAGDALIFLTGDEAAAIMVHGAADNRTAAPPATHTWRVMERLQS